MTGIGLARPPQPVPGRTRGDDREQETGTSLPTCRRWNNAWRLSAGPEESQVRQA